MTMNKEEATAEAKRLGIETEGRSYQDIISDVYKWRREHPGEEVKVIQPNEEFNGKKKIESKKGPRPISEYTGGTIQLAPEMASAKVQLFKYDEVLGDTTPIVREVMAGELVQKDADYQKRIGSYQVKSISKKPNIAQSTLPQQNPGVDYDPKKDMTAVVTFQGQQGYIWNKMPVGKAPDGTMLYLPGVKDLLKGRFPEYIERFKDDKLFYLGTTKLCADIGFTRAIFREIEYKEKERSKLGLTE